MKKAYDHPMVCAFNLSVPLSEKELSIQLYLFVRLLLVIVNYFLVDYFSVLYDNEKRTILA
ncbi:hypothetical protein LI951_11070 [Enterococcus sp. BWT-B8]|uniref:hypothetical protein n=1 Tax=Enterococcus sp. BWT-B8 TaxID=2885157 RepID=UPI001E3C668D|nr:hypothetical protein [Enterococcus sp. BWT-B8]MCB5952608.1 hypothetical protein [Enterococcus sp. BWT-B8]